MFTTPPFWHAQAMFASADAPPHSWGDLSRYSTAPLPDHAIEGVVERLANCPSATGTANGSFWSLGWVGGPVVGSIARRETAYVHRDVLTLLRATPDWPNGATKVGDRLLEWTSDLMRSIERYTIKESYQNFPNTTIADWRHEYYGENFDRLVDVKTRYDPDNVFRNAQSIPPRRA